MFPSAFFSLKSVIALIVLLIATGIGSILYFTIETDFETQTRMKLRTNILDSLKGEFSTDAIKQIMNTANEVWSIVNNK